jgi:hypothetical protein
MRMKLASASELPSDAPPPDPPLELVDPPLELLDPPLELPPSFGGR